MFCRGRRLKERNRASGEVMVFKKPVARKKAAQKFKDVRRVK
jgi:hypothetical protein